MARKKRKSKQSTSIPEKFLERLTDMFGVSLFNQINSTFVKRPVTFRVNTIKATKPAFAKATAGKQEIKKELLDAGFKLKDVSWYRDAFILQNKWKQDIMDLDIYKDGKIYMQSLASMVPPLVLGPEPGEKVLDLTAAPGSKTSQIAALMDRKGELIANDNNKIRFFKLKHNMELLSVIPRSQEATRNLSEEKNFGIQKTAVYPSSETLKDPSSYTGSTQDFLKLRQEHGIALCKEYGEYFDKILLDAPCSAETRFLADKPKSFSFWYERKVKEMAFKQAGLLRAAWGALKPGGVLVYSTCTFAPEENELQVSRFMEQNTDCEILDIDLENIKRLPITKLWKGKEINKEVIKKALRIMPDKEIEGFFVVKMRKNTEDME